MTHHYDFQGKTKSERRERGREKKKERMNQGKGVKLRARIIQDKAEEVKKLEDARVAKEAKETKGSYRDTPSYP